jgi:hypothetical protein
MQALPSRRGVAAMHCKGRIIVGRAPLVIDLVTRLAAKPSSAYWSILLHKSDAGRPSRTGAIALGLVMASVDLGRAVIYTRADAAREWRIGPSFCKLASIRMATFDAAGHDEASQPIEARLQGAACQIVRRVGCRRAMRSGKTPTTYRSVHR